MKRIVTGAIAAIGVIAMPLAAIALLVGSLTRRLMLRIEGDRFHAHPIAQATVSAVRRVTFVLSLLVLAFPALDLAGVELTVGLRPEDLSRWLTQSGTRILLRDREHGLPIHGDDFGARVLLRDRHAE